MISLQRESSWNDKGLSSTLIQEAIKPIMGVMEAATADLFMFEAKGLAERVIRQLKVATEDWADSCRRLSDFEQRYLIDDPLNEEALAKHALALAALEKIGRLVSLTTEDSQFPDRQFAERVAAQLQDLKDRRAMWHSKMPQQERDQILRDVFNEF